MRGVLKEQSLDPSEVKWRAGKELLGHWRSGHNGSRAGAGSYIQMQD